MAIKVFNNQYNNKKYRSLGHLQGDGDTTPLPTEDYATLDQTDEDSTQLLSVEQSLIIIPGTPQPPCQSKPYFNPRSSSPQPANHNFSGSPCSMPHT